MYIIESLSEYFTKQKKRKNGPLIKNKNSFVLRCAISILSNESVNCFFVSCSFINISAAFDFSEKLKRFLCKRYSASNELTLKFVRFLKTLSLIDSANLRLAAGD
jgi:DeoR/GlpR family transcriptional regulator of sugar metabolism